jgi:hypothetical protein
VNVSSILVSARNNTKYENFLILGDLNYDMLVNEKCRALKEVCDIFDLTNMVVDHF